MIEILTFVFFDTIGRAVSMGLTPRMVWTWGLYTSLWALWWFQITAASLLVE